MNEEPIADLPPASRATTRRADEAGDADDDFSAAGLAEMRRVFEDEGAAEIVTAMADDLPTQGAALDRAASERDARSLKRAAHSVKSAARMVGADALGDLWEHIERLSADATLDEAIAQFPAALTRQRRLLARLCRELGIGA